jgi:hypothetical protein
MIIAHRTYLDFISLLRLFLLSFSGSLSFSFSFSFSFFRSDLGDRSFLLVCLASLSNAFVVTDGASGGSRDSIAGLAVGLSSAFASVFGGLTRLRFLARSGWSFSYWSRSRSYSSFKRSASASYGYY